MQASESSDTAQIIADLTLRLQAAERLLAAREATIISLTHSTGRGSKSDADQEVMEQNAALQHVVAQKTLEMEAQGQRLKLSEQGFTGAFEHAPIGVALLSLEGHW